MKRSNQISYGDIFSSSSQSYENRFKKHQNEAGQDIYSQGSSQMMFSQSDMIESQNSYVRLSQPNEISARRSFQEPSTSASQKQLVTGKFQNSSQKSVAPSLGLCRAMAQEIEEREFLETILSTMRTHSSDIKELGYLFREKIDHTALLSNNQFAKHFEDFRDLLSKHSSEILKTCKESRESNDNDEEFKKNLLTEINTLKSVLENQTKAVERLLKSSEENSKAVDKSISCLKKEVDESLGIYAKELTDLLRSFKDMIESSVSRSVTDLVSCLSERLSNLQLVQSKKVCDKDVQVYQETSGACLSTVKSHVMEPPAMSSIVRENRTYSVNYSSYESDSFGGRTRGVTDGSGYVDPRASDYPAINLTVPKAPVRLAESECTFDSAIGLNSSSPLDLSMKNLYIDSGDERACDDGDATDDARDDDDLNDLVGDNMGRVRLQSIRTIQGSGGVSLQTCTYQKTVTFWGDNSDSLYVLKNGCIDLSRSGNFSNLSFNCPMSTPLSLQKANDGHEQECASTVGYNNPAREEQERKIQAQTEGTKKGKQFRKKASRKANGRDVPYVKRARKTRGKSDLSYDCLPDFEHLDDSDKENWEPEVIGICTRSMKKNKTAREEECSCTSNSTKSSSDGMSQLFTVLDIY